MSTRTSLANAIRALSMDAIQKANSGHPGAPMGMADMAEVLWNDFLSHNPVDPSWADRDRFVLSNGHGSMLLYSLLHLAGYDISIDDIKDFRQWESKTPGHPEYGDTPGAETTTGPLGQGIANAVGMALAEKMLADRFNKPGHRIVDHNTYVFLGDGCMMEGVSHEACALAGNWGLGKLVALWDDNKISIDGNTDGWFSDDTAGRFAAYGWHVVTGIDGHNPEQVRQALEEARGVTGKPSLICCRTVIGFGSPNKQGTSATHGAPLGDDEIAATRKELGWNHSPFEIPADVYDGWDAKERGTEVQESWDRRFVAYQDAYPELAAEFSRRMAGELPADWSEQADAAIQKLAEEGASVASRKASQMALEAFGPHLPELAGGSADLAGSNLTIWSGSVDIKEGSDNGNYIYFGVREFGMSAICNGLALHGGFIPYSATFLVFSDYSRNALRMSALLPVRSVHVFTHDSIGLGEDGPTHQPVEHVASLRLIPNMDVWRPCDTVESAVAWRAAIERLDGPSSLIFSRQGLPHQQRSTAQVADIARGGYILRDSDGAPDAIIMASGSEIGLAVAAADKLAADGTAVRIVSMPSVDLFDRQDGDYQAQVLPAGVTARVAVEAGSSSGWYKYVGTAGAVVGQDSFGASAPADVLFEKFGFTVDHVVAAVKSTL